MSRIDAPMPPSVGGLPESGARPAALDPTRDVNGPGAGVGQRAGARRSEMAAALDRARHYGPKNNELTRPETVAMLSHDWAVPRQLVQRLLDLEAENLLLRADIHMIFGRLNKLESK